MARSGPSGKVQTVLGEIDPDLIGFTSMHDHLLLDFTWVFKPPSEASERFKAFQPVSQDNLGWVNYDPFRNYDNLLTIDEEVAISEARLFKNAGGDTLVDVTSVGLSRDPLALARISSSLGINVVMGSGYYINQLHPSDMSAKTEAEIADEIIADISDGVSDTGIKAGIIGELGCSWPLTPNESKVLRAGAMAQKETGAPLTVHPGRNRDAPFEILEILSGAGADIGRVIMCHLDRTFYDMETVLEFAKLGSCMEYDFFGWEISYFSYGERDMPNDATRIGYIKNLIDEGYSDSIVIGHDMFGKHRLSKYGGHGFSHIPENIVPRMRERDFEEEQINAIVVDNPRRLLTFG